MFLLCGFATSLVDQALAIAGQIALTQLGSTYSQQLATAFKNAADTFTRPAEAVAWSRYVDRPPFNIISFDHWHFRPLPYNQTTHPVRTHFNEDDLQTPLVGSSSMLYNLEHGTYDRPWTFAFAVKVVLGAIADSLAPLHTTELFSDDFPNGDNSGRRFNVIIDCQTTTLFKAWESGCGAFADNLTFNDADWIIIQNLATAITAAWPRPTTTYNPQTAIAGSHAFDTTVTYRNLKPGATLSQAYRANCTLQTSKNIAYAGYAIADVFSQVTFPATVNAPTSTRMRRSEVASWAIMGALAPIVAVLLWKWVSGR